MFRSVRTLLSGKDRSAATAPAGGDDVPCPATHTYVVGDLHGRADLLELLLEKIDAHIGGVGARDPHLVFLGDYIDLGPDGAEVLRRLRGLMQEFPENVTCLMGNHERMLLDFLVDPVTRGPRWLRAGGDTTLLSFRIDPAPLGPGAEAALFETAADRLRAAMGPELHAWVTGLPLSWSSGTLWAVHAGADPHHGMADQTGRVLLWGHPEFETTPRGDALWIAHGHAEVTEAWMGKGRIALDTGAWRTGRLSAAALHPDGRCDLLQT